MSKSKKIIYAILIIVIIFAAYKLINNKNTNTNNEEVLYPAINDELISELEEGKKTYLFDSEGVLNEYLAKTYPDSKFEIKDKKDSGNTIIYNISLADKDKDLELSLKQKEIELNKEKLNIWVVTDSKEITKK
ncbi:MAG: hypothetical protein PUG50_03580 [Eubacteriales bacterium]|uniref:hypothetical protein n=1 Tax=Fenollaria sp. TaxID=1965292 RepID=UPI002A763B79|nr:hypothetical protein [Fenollaria sp.]MDD7339650.1 hypothetical protein [Eubacteriales bacterium]MDY3106436.1 hypothetical protein [Fenollaria sp.]